MEIRLARFADWKGLRHVLEAFGPNPISELKFHVTMCARAHAGIRTFVADHCGEIIGTASVIVEPKLIHGGRCVGHIEDVAVLPEHRRIGVARSLLRHIEAYCKHRDCYKIILNCNPDLVPFYARLGFRQSSEGMRLDLPEQDSGIQEIS